MIKKISVGIIGHILCNIHDRYNIFDYKQLTITYYLHCNQGNTPLILLYEFQNDKNIFLSF